MSVFHKHRTANMALFSDSLISREYGVFCDWLRGCVQSRKLGRFTDRYCAPFLELEIRDGQYPDWLTLYRTLSPGELRKYPLLERWLLEREPSLMFSTVKHLSAEEHYFCNLLARCEKIETGEVLLRYVSFLEKKQSLGVELRTIRMALSAATALMENRSNPKKGIPVQKDVVSYLRQKPGQRANLWGFITFLNRNCHAALHMPTVSGKKHSAPRQIQTLEAQLIQMLDDGLDYNEDQWLRVALARFHYISLKKADSMIRQGEVSHHSDGVSLCFQGNTYWIPLPKG